MRKGYSCSGSLRRSVDGRYREYPARRRRIQEFTLARRYRVIWSGARMRSLEEGRIPGFDQRAFR